MRRRLVIGALEAIDIPAWGVFGLDARVDTGAQTSALHVENLRELGGGRVAFDVRLKPRGKGATTSVVAAVARRGQVRSSNGGLAARLFVAARLQLGPVLRRVEVGLVDRRRMTYRMLLGRSALAGYFLVDPGAERNLSRESQSVARRALKKRARKRRPGSA